MSRYRSRWWEPVYTGRCKQPEDRPEVSKRLVSIMASQRRGHARPEYGRVSGRIDHRNLWRASVGDNRVFTHPGAPSPTRLRLVILMDLSGSMSGRVASNAAQMSWDLITAATQAPNVSCEVWGHTTAALPEGDALSEGCTGTYDIPSGRGFIKLVELWKPGFTTWNFHRAILSNEFVGNEDGWVIKVLADDVERRVQTGERVVFIVVSDGQPIYRERGKEFGHVRGVVNNIRRHGHVVVSVSVSEYLRADVQANMYGDGNVIEYTRDVNTLTQNIARVIGRALN